MRYFVGFLIFVGLVILGFSIFHHGGSKAPKPLYLPDYAQTTTVVEFNTTGPVVYDSNHQEIDITVGQYQNTISIIRGYQGNVYKTASYPNNSNAYNEFLNAIQIAGFTSHQKFSGSDIGACATANRYYFKIVDSFGNQLQNNWGSDCNEGTFAGNLPNLQNLFQAQIPNYNSVISGINFQ